MILAITTSKLLRNGCIGYWCCALEVKEEETNIENIPMVCEFLDLSSEELPCLPLNERLILKLS